MNPDSNRFEHLSAEGDDQLKKLSETLLAEAQAQILGTQLDLSSGHVRLLRPNGQPVPETWAQFQIGELVILKGYTFKVAYIGETVLLFEPVGPVLVGQPENT